MRKVTTTVYEQEDYEKTWDMKLEEVVEILQSIDDNYIGESEYLYNDKSYFEGDTDDYFKYKYHVALVKAEKIIRKYQSDYEDD